MNGVTHNGQNFWQKKKKMKTGRTRTSHTFFVDDRETASATDRGQIKSFLIHILNYFNRLNVRKTEFNRAGRVNDLGGPQNL